MTATWEGKGLQSIGMVVNSTVRPTDVSIRVLSTANHDMTLARFKEFIAWLKHQPQIVRLEWYGHFLFNSLVRTLRSTKIKLHTLTLSIRPCWSKKQNKCMDLDAFFGCLDVDVLEHLTFEFLICAESASIVPKFGTLLSTSTKLKTFRVNLGRYVSLAPLFEKKWTCGLVSLGIAHSMFPSTPRELDHVVHTFSKIAPTLVELDLQETIIKPRTATVFSDTIFPSLSKLRILNIEHAYDGIGENIAPCVMRLPNQLDVLVGTGGSVDENEIFALVRKTKWYDGAVGHIRWQKAWLETLQRNFECSRWWNNKKDQHFVSHPNFFTFVLNAERTFVSPASRFVRKDGDHAIVLRVWKWLATPET
jgi:hypothetical protein